MGSLSGYLYRKSFSTSHATGVLTNYQVKILVGESSGATGEEVDCGGLCLSDFDDLRFTKSDGTTLLDYWIESVTGTTPNQLATVWVELDSIGTGTTSFYMYYGNSGASAYSDGADTFPSFSDNNTLDGVYVSGDLTARFRLSIPDDASYSGCFLQGATDADYIQIYVEQAATNHSVFRCRKDSTGSIISYTALGLGSYHIFTINRIVTGTDTASGTIDGSSLGSGTTNVPTVDLKILDFKPYEAGQSWIFLKQYVAVEPSTLSFGAKEDMYLVLSTEAATSITISGFTCNGTIVTIGNNPTIRGFAYIEGTSGDPLISDNEVHEDGDYGVGAYSLPVTGLTDGTGYRVASYATDEISTAYGDTVQVTTVAIVAPTVTTQAITSITEMTGTGNGNITDDGGGVTTERGVCLKKGSGETPTISDIIFHDHVDATGAFTVSITGLLAGTTYSYRAYAINSKGNGYGETLEITTKILTVSTQEITNPRETSSTGNGTITALGDHTVDVRGFCWVSGGMGIDPVVTDNIVSESVGGYNTGAYSLEITGVPLGESYRVRAYATDAHRTVYGQTVIKRNMLRSRFSLNIVDKHFSIKIANASGNVLGLDKIRFLFNNKNERNKTIPLNVNSHHFSIKFTNSGLLKHTSLNIETLGAR